MPLKGVTWGFYIQGDEVINENDLDKIVSAANKYRDDKEWKVFFLTTCTSTATIII